MSKSGSLLGRSDDEHTGVGFAEISIFYVTQDAVVIGMIPFYRHLAIQRSIDCCLPLFNLMCGPPGM